VNVIREKLKAEGFAPWAGVMGGIVGPPEQQFMFIKFRGWNFSNSFRKYCTKSAYSLIINQFSGLRPTGAAKRPAVFGSFGRTACELLAVF
jgi:hypothetical protein